MPINIEIGGRGQNWAVLEECLIIFAPDCLNFEKKNWKEVPLIFCIKFSKKHCLQSLKYLSEFYRSSELQISTITSQQPINLAFIRLIGDHKFRDIYTVPKQTFLEGGFKKLGN